MSADTTLDRFVHSRILAVLTRLILGEIVSDDLDEVFESSRVRGYQRDLLHSQLAIAISEVVLGLLEFAGLKPRAARDGLHAVDQRSGLGTSIAAIRYPRGST